MLGWSLLGINVAVFKEFNRFIWSMEICVLSSSALLCRLRKKKGS